MIDHLETSLDAKKTTCVALRAWKLVSAERQGGIATVKFNVDLPKFQETFARSPQMVDGENVIYIDSEPTSDTAFDRTANWARTPFCFHRTRTYQIDATAPSS